MSKLTVSGLEKIFQDGKRGDVIALKDLSFEVNNGEFFCIVGPSGCGKSTLLQMVLGLERPSRGIIKIDDSPVNGPRQDCGMVFQEYALFPWKTILQNVEFGPKMRRIPKQERRDISRKYIELTGLQGFEEYYPHEISGGMKQRVAIARALANEPSILLMDEPFAAVDAQLRENLQHEILQIWNKTKKTIIFVTHQIEEAVFLADRLLVMSARPGSVKVILEHNLPRPREQDTRTSPDFRKMEQYVRELVLERISRKEKAERYSRGD